MAISKTVAAPVFAVMAVIHAIRVVQAWPASINGMAIPVWASAVVALAFGLLAVLLWRDRGPRSES